MKTIVPRTLFIVIITCYCFSAVGGYLILLESVVRGTEKPGKVVPQKPSRPIDHVPQWAPLNHVPPTSKSESIDYDLPPCSGLVASRNGFERVFWPAVLQTPTSIDLFTSEPRSPPSA